SGRDAHRRQSAPAVPGGMAHSAGLAGPGSVEKVSVLVAQRSPGLSAFAMVCAMTTGKKPARRRHGGRRRTPAQAPLDLPLEEPARPPPEAAPADVAPADPEVRFAARVPAPEPERPRPSIRRAIYFDVENSSRADHPRDAVGDVATSLGVGFRRLSYRAVAGAAAEPLPEQARAREPRSRRRRRGGRHGRREEAAPSPPATAATPVANGSEPAGEGHTAPHDELLAVARELLARAPERTVSIDALSNALKARGFRRTTGSPRLITRLRRIKELEVGRMGAVRLVEPGPAEEPAAHGTEEAETAERSAGEPEAASAAADTASPPTPGKRRRRRRGGRRRRGRGG